MIPNPWIIVGALVVWAASLGVVGIKANKIGHESERVAWQAKDNAALTAANATIKRLNDAARATEQKTNATIASMGADHAAALETLETRRRRDVAAAHDGSLRLRIAGACPQRPSGGSPGEAAPAASDGDGAASIELPREVTANLLALANDADQVTDQLRSCQGVVRAYFNAANGEPLPVLPNFQKEREL